MSAQGPYYRPEILSEIISYLPRRDSLFLAKTHSTAYNLVQPCSYHECLQFAREIARRGDSVIPDYWIIEEFTHDVLSGAAEGGRAPLCEIALKWINNDDPDMLERVHNTMLRMAARGGHESLCRLVRNWMYALSHALRPDYDTMIECAALGGHVAICRLAYEWGRASSKLFSANRMLAGAARRGDAALCILAHELGCDGSSIFQEALDIACEGGFVDICLLIIAWMRAEGHHISFARMFIFAVSSGCVRLCQLAYDESKVFGQRLDYETALEVATDYNHGDICRLICKWRASTQS